MLLLLLLFWGKGLGVLLLLLLFLKQYEIFYSGGNAWSVILTNRVRSTTGKGRGVGGGGGEGGGGTKQPSDLLRVI